MEILRIIEEETEIPRNDILSKKKQADIVEARCLFFYCLRKVGFYPAQIARMSHMSRQSVSFLLNTFNIKREYSGKMMTIYLSHIRKRMSELGLL